MAYEIILMRQPRKEITEKDRQTAWAVLCGFVDGHSENDKRAWRQLLNAWFKLEEGELSAVQVHVPRMSGTHNRHFAMEKRFFEAQEIFTDFERGFRDWTKSGAGFVEWSTNTAGEMVAVPKSMRWTDLDELGMREVHLNIVGFLRTPQASLRLWPHLSERARTEMVEGLLKGFGE